MKSYHNLFECMCANAVYNISHKTLQHKKDQYSEYGKHFGKKYWAFVDSLVPSLISPLAVIEEFLGEPYDFTKHIQPLIDQKLIWMRDHTNCFPHSKELAKNSLKEHGIVKDYESGICYVQFYVGPEDPNAIPKELWI